MKIARLDLIDRKAWLAGLVVGGCVGFLFGVWPTLGAVILVAFAIPVAISRRRRAAAPGLLVGLAAVWLMLLVVANANCSAFATGPNRDCVAPDLTGWVIVAIALLVSGGAGSVDLARRRPPGHDCGGA